MESRDERTTETGQEPLDEGKFHPSHDESVVLPSQSPAPEDESVANDTNETSVGLMDKFADDSPSPPEGRTSAGNG